MTAASFAVVQQFRMILDVALHDLGLSTYVNTVSETLVRLPDAV